MRAFEHTTATNPQEALTLLGRHPGGQAQLIAGGTDLLTLMKDDLVAPPS